MSWLRSLAVCCCLLLLFPTRVAAAPPARQTHDQLFAMLLTQPIEANEQESDKKQKVA